MVSEYDESADVANSSDGPTPSAQGGISEFDANSAAGNLLSKESRVILRDEHGNELDPELVKSLHEEGKVEFKTIHRKQDRIVDEHGNIVFESEPEVIDVDNEGDEYEEDEDEDEDYEEED
jgi:hypothetical protein